MKVGIVAQRGNDRATTLAGRLGEQVREAGAAVVLNETTGEALAEEVRFESVGIDAMASCDLVVSVGGDGTFLFAARGAGSTPLLGVNLGEVGFLNAVSPEDAVETTLAEVERIREGGAPRTRAMARIAATGEEWSLAPAVNEVVLNGPRRGPGGGGAFEVSIDGSAYAAGRADGVLVATPTGSTAYNLSEDGPLVHPSVDGFVVTHMAGERAMPPLVVHHDSEITVRVTDCETAVVVSDGRISRRISPPERVTLSRADEPVRVAGPPRDFFGALGKLD